MVSFRDFDKDEFENSILVEIDALENQSSSNNTNGITSELIANQLDINTERVNQSIINLISKGYIEAIYNEESSNYYFCKCSEKAKKVFSEIEKRPLTEIATLVLKTAYTWYIRNGYVKDTQENSLLIAFALGINNVEKINDAIQFLIDKGLLKKWTITRQYILFGITTNGVIRMENPKQNESNITPIIIRENSGNISIGSQDVNQTINNKELDQAFNNLRDLIISKIDEPKQKELLEDLETAQELSKNESPKIHLITRLLNHMKDIPVLLGAATAIIEMINKLG